MTKTETYEYLSKQHIRYEVTEHKAVYHMGELEGAALPYPDLNAKNLFVHDDKKRNYYLISIRGDKHLKLKEFEKQNQLRRLSFASEEDLMRMMKLVPGEVTPLGLLNDEERIIQFYLDQSFCGGMVGVHPNDNTATVWINADDLIQLVQKHGNPVHVIAI